MIHSDVVGGDVAVCGGGAMEEDTDDEVVVGDTKRPLFAADIWL